MVKGRKADRGGSVGRVSVWFSQEFANLWDNWTREEHWRCGGSVASVLLQASWSWLQQVQFFHIYTYINISVACMDFSLIYTWKFISSIYIPTTSDLALQLIVILTTLTWIKILGYSSLVPVIINITTQYYCGIVVISELWVATELFRCKNSWYVFGARGQTEVYH